MYQASDLFKKAISQNNRELRIRATIDNKLYQDTDIQDCNIEESILTSEDFKFGSSTASSFDLTLLNMDDTLTAKSFEGKTVHVEIGAMIDKFSQPFEFVSMGFFVVEEASKDNNLIKLTGYDKMIYFEKTYTSALTYPATLKQILQEVCSLAEVELQTTSFINDDYIVEDEPDLSNATLRSALEYISELSCSFACVNRTGKLELVTLKETDTSINADNYYSMNLSEYEYGPIEQISISQDNIFAENLAQTQKDKMLNAVKGFTFKPFNCSWQGNPLTAPGDVIKVSYKNGDTYKSFIANQKFNFSTGLKCDISTKAKTAIRSETETQGPISKVVESTKREVKSKFEQVADRITMEVSRIDGDIESANSKIELTADSINLSVDKKIKNVTDSIDQDISKINESLEAIDEDISGLDGAVYDLQSSITQTASEIRSEVNANVTRLDGNVANLNSSISQTAAQISSKVSYSDFTGNTIASLITQDAYSISFLAEKLKLQGLVSFSSLSTPGQTNIDGANISTGKIVGRDWISYSEATPYKIYIGGINNLAMQVYYGSLRLSYGDQEYLTVNRSSFLWSGYQMATQNWVQLQGYGTGDVNWVDTYRLARGSASLNFVSSGSAKIQCMNYWGSSYGTFEGLAYSNVSRRDLKKDIELFDKSALQLISDTPVHSYRYKVDLDSEPKRVGLIFDESPMEIMEFSGGIDIYAMSALAWKAIQELKNEIDILKGVA